MYDVVTQIVKNGLCSGCGICAGVQNECLTMELNRWGEFIPKKSSCNDCGTCLSLCPFFNGNFKHLDNTTIGTHTESYVGYSNIYKERKNGSSGGLCTRILNALLDRKMVDGAVVVGASKKSDRIFEPIIVKNSEELINAAGSKYYPVEFSSIISILKKQDGEYAFVGLPCAIKALRMLKQKNSLLGNKIKYLLGLVCGHNKNINYTSFLLNLTGSDLKDIETVKYRVKNTTRRASNFGFLGIEKNGKPTKQLNFTESLIMPTWCDYYFSLKSCLYCNDLFAHDADITFMDAWLTPYIEDNNGTSIAILRNNNLKELIESEAKQGNIKIDKINADKVAISQTGALHIKKRSISKKTGLRFNRWISNKLYSDIRAKAVLGERGLLLWIVFSIKASKIVQKIKYLLFCDRRYV